VNLFVLSLGAGRLLRISNVGHDFAKVPTKPPSNVEEVRNQYDQSLVQKLEEVNTSL